MDVKYINPFLDSTLNVLSTMAFTEAKPGTPEIKKDKLSYGDVSGIIGLAGENVNGNMVISFSKECILSIVSKMLGEEFTEINDEIIDAVGELTNMISGGAKNSLSDLGIKIGMAVPVMLVGQGVEITQLKSTPVLTIPFETENGSFVVEANLGENKKA